MAQDGFFNAPPAPLSMSNNQPPPLEIAQGANLATDEMPPANFATDEMPPAPLSKNNQQMQFAPWSACLLVKDNNIILPEWLAYHYTVLPLRRLIVAVDPSSKTDPTKYILDQYKSIGMSITVWTDEDYWVNGRRFHEQKNFRITNETPPAYAQDRLVYRQKIFYHKCLKQLKRENRTWTAVIDTDEYIAFNYLDESSSEGIPIWCYTKDDFNGYPMVHRRQCEETCSAFNLTCDEIHNVGFHCRIPDCANQHLRKTFRTQLNQSASFRTHLNQSATAAEHIEKQIDRQFDMHDCIVLARYLFSSRERSKNMVEMDVDGAFNTTLFHTLRYHFRTGLDNAQPGKSIIDVSRYDGRRIISPHRLHRKCLSEERAFVNNFKMSFRVHHYVGSWESFRLRGLELFMQRNHQERWVVDNTTPQYTAKEGTRTWLSQFVTLVGSKEKALELTERIRVREEREVEQYVKSSSNIEETMDSHSIGFAHKFIPLKQRNQLVPCVIDIQSTWNPHRRKFTWNPMDNYVQNQPTDKGLLYIKIEKAASSTLASVAARIAHAVAIRSNANVTRTDGSKVPKICRFRGLTHLWSTRSPDFAARNREDTFLWTFLKDPAKIELSIYFFFMIDWTPGKRNYTETDVIDYLNETKFGQLQRLHPHREKEFFEVIMNDDALAKQFVQKTVEQMDFLGLVERMDESLVLLSFILDLPVTDVLYLDSELDVISEFRNTSCLNKMADGGVFYLR